MIIPRRTAEKAVPRVSTELGAPAQDGFPLISAPRIELIVPGAIRPAEPRLIVINRVTMILRASAERFITNGLAYLTG
jgi:hypothetical protein